MFCALFFYISNQINYMCMIHYLQNKPLVGVVMSFGGGLITTMTDLLTSDLFARGISNAAGLMGFIAGALTVAIQAIKIYREVKNKKGGSDG